MNLPGRLKLSTLGDMLGVLHRSGASGVLELIEHDGVPGRIHRVYLDAGLIDGIDSRLPAPKLGELLLREGLLTLDGIRVLLRKVTEQPTRKAGQILLEERLLDATGLKAALRLQLKARLDALFGLRDALVRFHVRRGGAGESRTTPLRASEFLHGRPRARGREQQERTRQGREARPSEATERARRSAYGALGLSPGASTEEVRRAFRRLAALHHPDRHPSASSAEKTVIVQRFAELTAAYHRICR